jgi:hypothetical protein
MYCTTADVDQIIGKLPIASGISVQAFLDDAWGEMHTYMLGIYDIPITVSAGTPSTTSGIVSNILNTIQKELAGGMLLLSLDTTSENANIHAYGEYLVGQAEKKLQDIQAQLLILPGVALDTDITDNVAKPGRVLSGSPDSASYFNRPYDEVGKVTIDGGP